jgi:hypothetical protein
MQDKVDYDLQKIVDDGNIGPDPSEAYMESLDLLDNVVRECMFVSKKYAGITSPTGRHFYASVLFTVLITRGVSLLNLAPHTPWAEKKIEHWDYASLAGIARTMIELRVAYYYLCSEECSYDEWNCRWNLFNLHDCVTRIRLFDARGETEQVEAFKIQADELRDRLNSNEFFCSLDSRQHKRLLHGQTAYLFPLEQIADKAGIPIEHFRWLYVLFSSHVHGLPMSFYRLGADNPERGRGIPSVIEDHYSSLCLTLAGSLLIKTRDEIQRLFDGLGRPVDEYSFDEDAEEALEAGLAVSESASIDATDDVRIVFTRTKDDAVTVTYVYRQTEELVLERSESEIDGGELLWFDPIFWSLSVNGEPATEQKVANAIEGVHLFRVDHETRTIIIKI